MIVVRNSFVAKPGLAGKLAAHLKDVASTFGLPNYRVLTDVTGDYNHVVMEYEVENLAEFERTFTEYMTKPDIREKMKGYTDLWTSGSRELFRIT